MVTFIKDEFHFTGQCTVFFVILKDNLIEAYLYPNFGTGRDIRHRCTFEVTSQKLHMSLIRQFAFESIAHALFLHYMNIKGFHKQSYLGSHLKVMIILHQKLVTTTKHRHFIVHPFEYGRLHYSCQLCHIGYRKNIQVFGTNHHIYRHVFTKTFVHTFKLYTGKTH